MWVGFMLVAVLTWPSLSSNVFAALTCNEKRRGENYCSCTRVGFRSFASGRIETKLQLSKSEFCSISATC